ncbi:divalent-cation tolerance protein CutA [Actinomadura opuntiae]|uniref:divalent-cation tolerance protein CutA n=1 Tax=Actinomadura sp. OS1-43 TaxID=604315 RepID=UPI00255ACE0A|nr:divalent-cation tolerance protein CutA [Actinomadura sp. OS1-43]MDL4812845.1 divalent-cation tolerance protein CutA [Actinomadura sp. OS1-43]
MANTRPLLVFTATPDRESGMQLLQAAVSSHLAAGGQVLGPAGNVFWHLGELGSGEEWQVTLRTTSRRYAELEALLRERHPWDNPELMYIEIAGGSKGFLDWLARETAQERSS